MLVKYAGAEATISVNLSSEPTPIPKKTLGVFTVLLAGLGIILINDQKESKK